jgi:hypothetical protein
MVWDSNLVKQAVQLANAAVDLLRQVAGVHDGGDVKQGLGRTQARLMFRSYLVSVQCLGVRLRLKLYVQSVDLSGVWYSHQASDARAGSQ